MIKMKEQLKSSFSLKYQSIANKEVLKKYNNNIINEGFLNCSESE